MDFFLSPATNLISIQIAATCSAAPTLFYFHPFRTPFSENPSSLRKPRAMIQLAKMQMKPILSWPSFTCSEEMGMGWGGRDSCVPGHGRHVEFVIVQGEPAVCDGQGDTSVCNDRISFPSMVIYSCTELKLIWSNTASCRAKNRSISVWS